MLVLYQCLVLVAMVITVSEAAPIYGCQHSYIQIYRDGEICGTVSNINLSGDLTTYVKNCDVVLKCEQTSLYACIDSGGYDTCKKILAGCDKLQRTNYEAGENLDCAY